MTKTKACASRTILLVIMVPSMVALCEAAAPPERKLESSGWFEVSPSAANLRLVDIDANDDGILFVFSGAGRSEFLHLSGQLTETVRWNVDQSVIGVKLDRNAKVLAYQKGKDGASLVRYSQTDGALLDSRKMRPDLEAISVVGDAVVGFDGDVVRHWADDVPNGRQAKPLGLSPYWTASTGSEFIVVSAMDGSLTRMTGPGSVSANFILDSPRLSDLRQRKDPDQGFIMMVKAGPQGLFVVPAAFNLFVGLPVELFAANGRLVESLTLTVPVFPELKRGPGSGLQNPTGHVIPSLLAVTSRRIFLADRVSKRVVHYQISQ